MTSYDVMPATELYQPVNIEDATALAARLGRKGWLLGGGQDTYGWLKDRAKRPDAFIDLTGIDVLKGIRSLPDGGVEIGSMTTITEVAQNPLINEKFTLLSAAAKTVASPQIRNMGTLGGNLCQDTRCWYYRRGLNCYRAGGNICYADSPEGMNREHALFGASRCVAVTPSDTAPALVALEATMLITSASGSRQVAAEDFFVGPATDILNMTALQADEILVSVRIPRKWADATFYHEKVADRNVWDFALVSLCAAFKEDAGQITDARLVAGGVDCVPHRLREVEQAIIGQPRNETTGEAVKVRATSAATTLNYNQFKVPLMQNLVLRALRG
ncbi:MAG: xanthine dehydrogenase family protein subunit M [Proteobacteria bacterium]|nr:xanthine dehydrogenase family protein subunit M [Pseudomonadota bacterium]